MPGTVRLHRVFATSPEKLYRAFVEADAMAKWLPPNGFTCTVHTLEPRVGGTHRMSFRNFTTGNGHSFGGTYHELVPNERLRYTDKFDDANLPGEMTVTVTLSAGTSATAATVTATTLAVPLGVMLGTPATAATVASSTTTPPTSATGGMLATAPTAAGLRAAATNAAQSSAAS